MKKILTAMLVGLSALGITMQYSHLASADLRGSVYRLHVIANSDTDADQQLKLKVRDRVITALDKLTPEGATLEQTKNITEANLEHICAEAVREIQSRGYDYPVTIRTGSFPFPTKNYGKVSLPEGKYDGLQVIIGEGKGQNWWCVMYPNLCFIDGVAKLPDDSSLEDIKNADLIKEPKSGKVQLKFKLLEIFD